MLLSYATMSPRYSRYTVEENSWTHLISEHFAPAPSTEQIHVETTSQLWEDLHPLCMHTAVLILPTPQLLSVRVNQCLGLLPGTGTEVSVLLNGWRSPWKSFAQAQLSQAIPSHSSGTGQDQAPFPTGHAYGHPCLETRANTGCFVSPRELLVC